MARKPKIAPIAEDLKEQKQVQQSKPQPTQQARQNPHAPQHGSKWGPQNPQYANNRTLGGKPHSQPGDHHHDYKIGFRRNSR